MNNGSKPTYVEPEGQHAAALDEVPDEKLTAQALEDIRSTERLSGFGRFATKMQNLFQGSSASQTKQQAHLKAAPILMSAGLLLLLATGLLYLLSKPESAVHSHFRQPTGLSGRDDSKSASGANADTTVTENQLAGRDLNRDQQMMNRAKAERGANSDEGPARRFSFSNAEGGSSTPSGMSNQTATNELQGPATVFVANPISNPVLNAAPTPDGTSQSDIQLASGTEIIAHTTNAISSGLESPVVAIVDRHVQLGDAVVIPQGSRVIGYTAGTVKDRINVRFTSLILPNSSRDVTISGLALMRDGSAGLVGKVQGSGHPVLATATRMGSGAAVVATQFVGQGALNQPFSQSDYLRNQMGYEIASQGNRYSNRLQQPTSIPIVTVNTNQSIRIFLLNALVLSGEHGRNSKPTQQRDMTTALAADQSQPPDQGLAAAQTVYIQALEAQLADMHAALDARKSNGHQ